MAHPFRLRPHRPRPGFTLIELLTAVAVVAILGTIMVATWGNTRARTHLAKCTHAIRSLHTTTALYLADNNNHYPPTHAKGYTTTYWRRAYLAYEGLSNDNAKYLDSMSQTSFICPEVGSYLQSHNKSDTFISYAMNDYLNELPAVNIDNPARTLLAMDGSAMPGSLPNESATPAILRKIARNFHGDSINLIFADGHIEQFADAIRLASAPYGPQQEKDVWSP